MKKVLKIVIIILNIIFVMGCQNILDKDLNNEKNSLAIMVEDENNSDKYTKYNNTNWPSSEEYYFYKADCQNNSEVNWNPDSNSIILKGNREDSCTLFFNKNKSFVLISDYELENRDARLTNMIKNGSFEEGENYWTNANTLVTSEIFSHGKFSLKFNYGNINARSLQVLDKKPIYGHTYYGRLKFKSSISFKSNDNRFEWDCNDKGGSQGVSGLIFAFKNIQVTDWTLMSDVVKLNSDVYVAEQWTIRNFQVAPNEVSYTDELMMIDLTESYGDNIPTKEFLDNNLVYFEGTIDLKTVKGNVGTFKLKANDGNITSESIECTNDAIATVQDKVITITSNNERTTCYLHKN